MRKNRDSNTVSVSEKRQKTNDKDVDEEKSSSNEFGFLDASDFTNSSAVTSTVQHLSVDINDAANNNELNELTSENNLISQQLKIPLSTNHVTINVNNFGNTVSNVFLFAQIIDGPGCYTIKDWIKKWCQLIILIFLAISSLFGPMMLHYVCVVSFYIDLFKFFKLFL